MKYKLIKLLPFENSPKIDYISKPMFENEPNRHYWNSNWFNPENYPEFWELVVEKNYEILSLKYIKSDNWLWDYKTNQIVDCKIENNKFQFKRINNNWDSYDSDYSGFITEVFSIHSVKRLSDSQIFTINDNCKHTGKIQSFKLDSKSNLCIVKFNSGEDILEFIEKSKQKLFTTFDNVDIFEGDEYFKVVNNTFQLVKIENADHDILNSKIFSTKEKAEEYILMNKPVLSLKDVASIYISADKPITETTSFSAQNRRIQELVKQKLK